MRDWKAWGVLGLLLALVFAVGYGQKVVPPAEVVKKPPEEVLPVLQQPDVCLTVRESVKSAPFAEPIGLYLVNMDMSAWRNLLWLVDQWVTCCFTTQGVAEFWDWRIDEIKAVVNIYGQFTQPGVYVFAAWFTPLTTLDPSQPPGRFIEMDCGFGPAGDPSAVSCKKSLVCPPCEVWYFTVEVPCEGSWQALWRFRVEGHPMLFVRATITKAFGPEVELSRILPGRLPSIPIPPPGEPEKGIE